MEASRRGGHHGASGRHSCPPRFFCSDDTSPFNAFQRALGFTAENDTSTADGSSTNTTASTKNTSSTADGSSGELLPPSSHLPSTECTNFFFSFFMLFHQSVFSTGMMFPPLDSVDGLSGAGNNPPPLVSGCHQLTDLEKVSSNQDRLDLSLQMPANDRSMEVSPNDISLVSSHPEWNDISLRRESADGSSNEASFIARETINVVRAVRVGSDVPSTSSTSSSARPSYTVRGNGTNLMFFICCIFLNMSSTGREISRGLQHSGATTGLLRLPMGSAVYNPLTINTYQYPVPFTYTSAAAHGRAAATVPPDFFVGSGSTASSSPQAGGRSAFTSSACYRANFSLGTIFFFN